jgi:hypothetical protein
MEMFAQQARELVAQMTLEEKVSQMRYDAPAIERLGIPAYNWWNECLHGCCFSKRMRKVFRKNEKSMLQNCNKKAKRKGRLQRVKKPM